jgi:AMMECR1 domain-containing protein
VTWEKQSGNGNYVLRGCIGTLSPCRLDLLKTYAFDSALHDDRFSPIVASELPSLQCSVSLLVNYEVCQHIFDWEVCCVKLND